MSDEHDELPPYLEQCLISAIVESLRILDTPQPNGNGELVEQLKVMYATLQERRQARKARKI